VKILIAEDDSVSRRLLEVTLVKWGYQVTVARDGREAWEKLRAADAPKLAILDWMMPGMDGVVVCRKVRELANRSYVYLIMLTAKGSKEDIATGLEAGADDYVNKPFDQRELHSRIKVGERVLALEQNLASKVSELEAALAQVKQLKGLLPICMYCKKIRDDQDYWHKIETYIHVHTGTDFSHGICPECYEKWLASRKAEQKQEEPSP
jgi:DNA-binding response OmpR family regulator